MLFRETISVEKYIPSISVQIGFLDFQGVSLNSHVFINEINDNM